ncbi:protein of unknown function [Ruminococcaceae bacterium BL-6]|nr:protein of unknown function [Ruminococcaceae bacterium BL-6]
MILKIASPRKSGGAFFMEFFTGGAVDGMEKLLYNRRRIGNKMQECAAGL